MANPNDQNRFIWYDLLTTDPEAAAPFYAEILGWGTTAWDGGDRSYTVWTNGEDMLAAVDRLPDEALAAGAVPHWLAYIATRDVDATVAQAQDLGSEVLTAATDVPAIGRIAVLRDPQGAFFAPFSPLAADPSGGPERPIETSAAIGEFSWHELATPDAEASLAFYGQLFGWAEVESFDMGEMGPYRMFGWSGPPTVGGIYNAPPDQPGGAAWLHYVRVPDVHAAADQVKQRGGQVVQEPMEVPGGDWVAMCVDPQGASFAVHQAAG